MTNKLTLPDDSNRIDEAERRILKLTTNQNWDTCTFCGNAPATHETGDWDYVCRDCWISYESYGNHVWGTCTTCERALNPDGTCQNCKYNEWKQEHGTCKRCGKELEFSSRAGTDFWIPCNCNG